MRLCFQRILLRLILITLVIIGTGCSTPASTQEAITVKPATQAITATPKECLSKITSPTPNPSNTPTAELDVTSTPGVTVVRFGTGQIGTDIFPYHQIIHEYELNNPDVIIQMEPMPDTDYYARLEKLELAGQSPDIIYLADDYLPFLVRRGMLRPLDLTLTKEYDPSQYYPGLLEPGQVDGQQYLLPGDFSPLALYYNKFLFTKAGVPFPEDNWTWDNLLAAARMLTKDENNDGKPEQWGIQMNANWDIGFEYWVAAAGGSLISPDGKQVVGYMDAPETVRAAKFYIDLYNLYKYAPPPADLEAWAGGNTEFSEGKAAMLISGRWVEPDFLANPGIDLGIAAPPRDKVRANILFWSGSGITSSTTHPAEASRFLAYTYGEESASVWKEWTLPVLSSHVNEEDIPFDPFWKIWYQELNFVKPRGYSRTPFWDEAVRPHLQKALTTLLTESTSNPDEVMKEAAITAQADLEELLAR